MVSNSEVSKEAYFKGGKEFEQVMRANKMVVEAFSKLLVSLDSKFKPGVSNSALVPIFNEDNIPIGYAIYSKGKYIGNVYYMHDYKAIPKVEIKKSIKLIKRRLEAQEVTG